jgi:hypothetical protein
MEIMTRLADDDTAGAERCAAHCRGKMSPVRFGFFDAYTVGAQCILDMYMGRSEVAHAYIEAHWRRLSSTELMKAKARRFEMLWWRGIAALGAGLAMSSQPGRRSSSRKALRMARAVARKLERLAFGPALAASNTLLAALSVRDGDRDDAIRRLREAEALFSLHEMKSCVAAARRCLGMLHGGTDGRAQVEKAESESLALGIRRPDRVIAVWFPGFEPGADRG